MVFNLSLETVQMPAQHSAKWCPWEKYELSGLAEDYCAEKVPKNVSI